MTVGTGFFGRSALTENLQPRHLIQWTRLAYDSDPAEPFGDFGDLEPWSVRARARAGRGPPAQPRRRADPRRAAPADPRRAARAGGALDGRAALRDLHRPAAAADDVLPRHLDPRAAAAQRHGGGRDRGGAGARHRAADRRRAQAHPAAGGHPRRRAPVRLPGVPLALDGGGAVGERGGARGARRLAGARRRGRRSSPRRSSRASTTSTRS